MRWRPLRATKLKVTFKSSAMASASIPFDSTVRRPGADEVPGAKPLARPAPTQRCLANAAVGETVRVVELTIEEDLSAWLSAVGVGVGERLTLLRRAAFGGPLHVRSAAGGEFALNVALARSIHVRADEDVDDTSAEPKPARESAA